MNEDDLENEEKREYSVSEDYNKSLSRPNLNLNSTLGINMQNLDSTDLGRPRFRDRILKDEPEDTKKKEDIPEVSEIYGDNSSYKEENDEIENKPNKLGEVKTNKVAPEYIVATITTVLIIIFMVLSFFLYNMFTG